MIKEGKVPVPSGSTVAETCGHDPIADNSSPSSHSLPLEPAEGAEHGAEHGAGALVWLLMGTLGGATAGLFLLLAWRLSGLHHVGLLPSALGSLFGGAHIGALGVAGLLALRSGHDPSVADSSLPHH